MTTHTLPTLVIKVGGNEIDDDRFLGQFVQALRAAQAHARPIVVHGGGKEIAALHERLGVAFDFVEGMRVTSAESLRLVTMVLNGLVNTRLTGWLVNGGIDALGLSGVDLGLVRVDPLRPGGRDIGFVGRVTQVRSDRLLTLLEAGVVPVISPISLGRDGQVYNVNADQVAAALAVAVDARRLAFVTNVPGVLLAGPDHPPVPRLGVAQAEGYIAGGQISGGMVPKVRAAIQAVQDGVAAAVITDLAGLGQGLGTAIVPDRGQRVD